MRMGETPWQISPTGAVAMTSHVPLKADLISQYIGLATKPVHIASVQHFSANTP